ncbi:MAG: penicillin-binding protein 2 [Deinococcota bacterium]
MVNDKQPETLRLQKRSLIWLILLVPLILALLGFLQLQLRLPDWPLAPYEDIRRGSIVATDGTVFAEGAVEARVYPQGRLAAHVVGFSGRRQPNGRYGLEGLEYTLDDRLRRGDTVTVTIDPVLQAAAQDALRRAALSRGAENGTFVILESETGRVLAAASYPDYDPNRLEQANSTSMINRTFLQQVEPGSTMKPFVIAALIESGLLDAGEILEVDMSMRVGNQTFRDVAQHGPILNVTEILRYSSNVGMIKLGQRFTPQALYHWFEAFGFGREVELDGAFTRAGQINAWEGWVPQDHASAAIGQSLSVTALQLVAAYNVFANDGVYVAPRLIEDEAWRPARRVVSAAVAKQIRQMLVYTVEESSLVRAKVPGFAVAGKSGTADIFDHDAGRYIEGDYTMSFAGIFPADDPKVTALVYLQKPQIGTTSSLVATPIFRVVGSEAIARWGLAPRE